MAMQSEDAISTLYQEAQTRWLKPQEVFFILQNHEKYELTHETPQKPKSGSLFLFNKKVLKFFRKDGHQWRRKKDGRVIAEAHERLKVGNVEALTCYYAHGELEPLFQRRIYWMLDPDYEHIVLVHYRDVSERKEVTSPIPSTLLSSQSSIGTQNIRYSHYSCDSTDDIHQHSSTSLGTAEVNSHILLKTGDDEMIEDDKTIEDDEVIEDYETIEDPTKTNNEDVVDKGGDSKNPSSGWLHNSSRLIRPSIASGAKDQHSNVFTSNGPRDRRVRLSVSTAIQFYDLQDRLGYDRPSKSVEWLIKAADESISKLPSLNTNFPTGIEIADQNQTLTGATHGKDRHSKVLTSKGLRDRRVRLSVPTAIQFYDLQDRLGYDQPSKAVEWLIKAAEESISELPSLSTNFQIDEENPSQILLTGAGAISLPKSACSINSETSENSSCVTLELQVLARKRAELRVLARKRAKLRVEARERAKLRVNVVSNTNEVFGPWNEQHASSSSLDYDDVVIRYRRGDISNDDFISHLHATLCRKGISVVEDFDDVEAIQGCRVLIIFLTSTYVSSSLLNILKHQRREGRVVFPIFYGITPSDLINNSQIYETFFLQDKPSMWQDALKEIAQMPGYTLTDKSESELIDEIVKDAWKVLCFNASKKMIGMDIQVDKILSLLCIESPDVRSIGLWGTVGIGKTAIAEEIFRRISVHYETCVFLKDLHTEVKLKGHDAVRVNFLSKVLEVDPHVIQISDIKTSFLRSRLQKKRLLVVLDDVNDLRDVETFLGQICYFGPGSRIIITSRDRRVFLLCKIDQVYEVKPLDISKSLLLLERGIFFSVLSNELYRIMSLDLIKFSNGNPQVLQFLSNREWKWLSKEVQKKSAIYIPGIFEKSCCGLDDNERSIFLDIACFFKRMDKDKIAMLLDGCGFSTHVGFRSLVDKSLLTISHDMVDMHGFIQATGREIVRRESAERPGDRSRLWNSEDIRHVLIDNTGTSAIEGIFLDMSELNVDANPYVFENMHNLRLLKFYCSKVTENCGVYLPQGLEYLPSKLRLLHWENYPLSSLPKSFDPKNLVELNLPNSCAKKLWKGKKSLEKLKKMRLSYSYQLTTIPKLSSVPNLEHIDLEGCISLVSISQSICYLKKLVFLNLKNCSNLESVPSTADLESLEVLNLSGCSKLENFPEISPKVKELYLGGTMLHEIPPAIKNLVLLEKLDLENSRHLKNLPTSICKLKHLETLNLSDCSSFERFPDLSRRMKCLKSVDLSRTAIKELPSSISYMTALEELRFVDCKNLVRLPDNTWSLRFKVEFRQIDTEKFSRLWNRFGWLKKVKLS